MQWKTEMYFKLNKSGGRSAVFWERVPDSPHTVIFVLGTEIRVFPDLDGSWHHTRPDMYFDTEKKVLKWMIWFNDWSKILHFHSIKKDLNSSESTGLSGCYPFNLMSDYTLDYFHLLCISVWSQSHPYDLFSPWK